MRCHTDLSVYELEGREETYVLLLLMHMANLEPNVLFGERGRGIGDNVLEAVKRGRVLGLLLVDDAEAEVDFV